MAHSLLPVFLHELPVLLARTFPESFAKLDHEQENGCACHANECSRYKAVLVTHVVNPGRDPIPNGERHGISHQDDAGHGNPTQLSVAVDEVIDTQCDSTGIGESEHAHGNNQSKPVNFVGGSNSPQEERSRHKEETCEEWPKTVFSFHDSIVPPGKFDC